MNRPPSVPQNYLFYKGDWCHPTRVPREVRLVQQCINDDNALQSHGTPPPSDSVSRGGVKTPKRIRQSSKPLLNKLEQRYWGYLTMLYTDHPIIAQGMKFRLANGCWYCPDFVVWGDENNRTRAFEIKGNQQLQDDSVVKVKVAAKEYHWINWYLVWWRDNQWYEQIVIP